MAWAPRNADAADDVDELAGIEGLGDEATGVQFVRPADVVGGARGRQHGKRNAVDVGRGGEHL